MIEVEWNSAITSDSFIMVCRNMYLSGMRPFERDITASKTYKRLGFIADQYTLNSFTGFLLEGQYYINLWACYFILEKFKPNWDEKLIGLNDEKLIAEDCIETVDLYAKTFKEKSQIDNYNSWITQIKNYYHIL